MQCGAGFHSLRRQSFRCVIMFGLFKKILPGGSTRKCWRSTDRSDWEFLNREIYGRVVSGAKFCMGVISSGEISDGGLKYRMNQDFPNREVRDFVRLKFLPDHFAKIFVSGGAKYDLPKHGLVKIGDSKLGLPVNTLIAPVTSSFDPKLKVLVIFGGQFVDNQMAARIDELEAILDKPDLRPGARPVGHGKGAKSRDDLVAMLEKVNVKRLFEHDLGELSQIVNGLEDFKDKLPSKLKPRYWAVGQYVLKQRL